MYSVKERGTFLRGNALTERPYPVRVELRLMKSTTASPAFSFCQGCVGVPGAIPIAPSFTLHVTSYSGTIT